MSRGSIYAGRAVILVTAEDRVAQGLRSIRTNLRKFGNSLSGLGDSAIRGGFLGGLISGSILRHFAQFEDKMLTLQAKLGIFGKATGRQADDIAMLEKSIRDLGATTSYTTAEVADAAISLAQAGFAPQKIKDSLKAVLDLARGTGYGLDQSAEMLANTMATFKIEGEDAVHVTNMFVKATRLGTIEIDDIRESLKYASGAMKNLNEDLPVLLAFLVQMSEAGLKASLAGTSLNTALNNMLKNAETFKKNYNVDIFTGIGADGKQKIDIVKTFKSIHEALAKLPIKDKLIAFNDMFNLRGARAVTATSDMESIVENMKKIIDSAGEAALAAKTMDQGLGGAIRRATGAVSDFAIAVGKMNLPITKTFLETIPVAIQILKDFMLQHEALVIAITLAPVGLIAAGIAFKVMAAGMMTAAAAITPLLGGLRKISGIITPGIGQQLAAIKALQEGAMGGAAKAGYATRGFMGRIGAGLGLFRQSVAKRKSLRAEAKLHFQLASGLSRTNSTQSKVHFDKGTDLLRRSRNNVSPMQAFFSAFKSMKIGSATAGIGSLVVSLGNLAKVMARFAFSAGGVTTIIQLLLIFGGRIPVVAAAFKSLGAGFSAAFGEIAKIGDLGGSSMALIFKGAEEFSFGNAAEGIRLVIAGVQTLVTIVKEQLLAAWHSFFEQVGWVYEVFKKIVVSVMELGKLMVGLGGNFVERIGRNLGNLLSGENLGLDYNVLFKEIVLGLGKTFKYFHDVINDFNFWMFDWLYKLNDILIRRNPFGVDNKALRQNNLDAELNRAKRLITEIEGNSQFREFEKEINKVFDEVIANLAKTAKEAAQKAALEAKYKAQSELAMSEGDSFWKGDLYGGKQPPKNLPGVADVGKELKKLIDSFVGYASHSRGNLIKAIGGKEKIEKEQLDALKGIEDGVVTLVRKGGKFVFS